MATKSKFYAYFVPGSKRGITDSWKACEVVVKGVQGARFKGFRDKTEATAWLERGANYSLKSRSKISPGIYFDAGTGRGSGVEISVTDHKGDNLLHKVLPKRQINIHGKHLISGRSVTNNYGELLALSYALKIAKKGGVKKVFGDSRLIVDFWSRWRIKHNNLPKETIELATKVSKLRHEFEKVGGSVRHISGNDNPADPGFHR